MKQLKLFMIITATSVFFTENVVAQSSKQKDEYCVQKGKFIFDVYYGYPYVMGNYVKSVFDSNSNNNNNNNSPIESVKNWNHIGGKFEYMINDEVGIGLEYTYASVDVNYKEDKSVIINGQSTVQTFHYKATLYKQRALARVNFHFATTDKFDPYGTIGFGYKASLLKSNNPDDQQSVKDFNTTFINIFPISFRLGIGARYFFTQNIGISAEAGIGGPSVQIGLCGKF
jgi:opacity protein-like surface antigen